MPQGNTYNLEHKAIDLSPVMNTLIAESPLFISLFPDKGAATQTRCEWFQDQIKGRSFTGTPTTGGKITIDATEFSKIRPEMHITVRNDSALFKVLTVTATEITVQFLASHGSSMTSIGDLPTELTTFNIAYEPIVEGSIDGEKVLHQPGKDYNFTQIFRRDIEFTRTAQAIKTLDGSNSFAQQELHAIEQLVRDINHGAIFGIREDDTSKMVRTFGGLYDFGTKPGCPSVFRTDGPILDSGLINDAAQLINDAGGNADTIIVGSGQRRVLSAEYKDRLHVIREDAQRGAFVAKIVSDSSGGMMTILCEPSLVDTHAWVVDSAGFGMRYLSPLLSTDAKTNTMDGDRRKIIGELTLEFKNAQHRLCLIKGLMESQDALKELRPKP